MLGGFARSGGERRVREGLALDVGDVERLRLDPGIENLQLERGGPAPPPALTVTVAVS